MHQAANRKLARTLGEIFPAPGFSLVPRTLWLGRFSFTILPEGAHLWYKVRNDLWWLGKVAHRASTDKYSANFYSARFLDGPG